LIYYNSPIQLQGERWSWGIQQ